MLSIQRSNQVLIFVLIFLFVNIVSTYQVIAQPQTAVFSASPINELGQFTSISQFISNLNGSAVAIDGSTAVIGAPYANVGGLNSGTVYVLVQQGSGWVLEAELISNNLTTANSFGAAVAIEGDTVVVGSPRFNFQPGQAHVFTRSAGSWSLQTTLVPTDSAPDDFFGKSVAIDNGSITVGAPTALVSGNPTGAAYVFTQSGNSWSQQAKLIATDGASDDQFGESVDIDMDSVIVGALGDDTAVINGGSGYIFTRTGTTWSQQAKVVQPTPSLNDVFGRSVAIEGNTAVLGMPKANGTAGEVVVFTLTGATWVHEATLSPPTGSAGDLFGMSIELEGNSLAIGAPRDDDEDSDAGAVYLYSRSGATWSQQSKLTKNNGEASDSLGWRVGLSGSFIIGGAPTLDLVGSNSGAALIFTQNGASWSEQTVPDFTDWAEGHEFGKSMAAHGNWLFVGAPLASGLESEAGAVYVYSTSGTAVSYRHKIVASDGEMGDRFGASLAFDGTHLLIGAHRAGTGGVVYVFTKSSATNTWHQQTKLISTDVQSNDLFGLSVAVDSGTAVIGAPDEDTNGADAGSAYVFTGSGSTWSQQEKLLGQDGASGDNFGWSVAVEDDTAVVGSLFDSPGSAYIFTRSGANWLQTAKLTASDGAMGNWFGRSVSLSGDTLLVGAPSANGQGAVYSFNRANSVWTENQKLVPTDIRAGDLFGYSVTLVGDTAVISAVGADNVVNTQGAAYVFKLANQSWNQIDRLEASNPNSNDQFGTSIAVSGNLIAVGAPFFENSFSGSDSGVGYRFMMPEAGELSASIAQSSQSEGDSGLTTFTFTINRSGRLSDSLTADYQIISGDTTVDDFGGAFPSGTVTVPANSQSVSLAINVSGDLISEGAEQFTLQLLNPSVGAILTGSTATATILNDDLASVAVTNAANLIVTEDGATDDYAVVLTSQPTEPVMVTIAGNGRLNYGNGDGVSQTLTFTTNNWDVPQMVTVTAVENNAVDSSSTETITHTVASDDANYDGLVLSPIPITIIDNDGAIIYLPLIVK
ncbi:MAG: hypothetical protein AAF490_09735 [Chloroflexota bacterium]